VDFHLEPCHDAHQLKETDIPHPKAIVGGECCPTMLYGHVIAGPTVTTLNTARFATPCSGSPPAEA